MSHFGIPKQGRQQRLRDIAQVNWRRGLFRVWLLFSAAWMMGWIVYLIINGIMDGLQSSGNLLARASDCPSALWNRCGLGASRLHVGIEKRKFVMHGVRVDVRKLC
jgi:hypothetical protein